MNPGEELEVGKVDAWLKDRVSGLSGALEVTQYRGGASNWTYRLRYASHDLVLRRPPAGTKAKSAHDMGREYRIQKALAPVFPFVPEMIAFCDDESVIGCEFYVMHRLDGTILRKDPPRDLALTPDQTRRLCLNVIDTLIALHRVDVTTPGLESLGKGAGYTRRQVEGWSDRYRKARTWNVPRLEDVMSWLAARTPEDVATCLIHNDFRFDNVVLDPKAPTRVVGVLDWEMATLGDPLADLGYTLIYWGEEGDPAEYLAALTGAAVTAQPGFFQRQELIETYARLSGRDVSAIEFYRVLAHYKLAVIVEGIHARFLAGETVGEGFEGMGDRCELLVEAALAIADSADDPRLRGTV